MAGGAYLAALRIAAALYERERSGRGAWLDVSMCEGVLAMVAPMAAAAAAGLQAQPGAEALTGGLPVYRCYPCRDGGVVAVAALEPRFQEALATAIGGELPEGESGMAALFASRDRDDWAALLGEACVTPVLSLEEALEHPQHRARGSVIGEGAARRVLPPFPGPHPWASEPAPQRGQDTVGALLDAWTSPPESTCG
jgi:alpha-methylacyl-CoA racemase